MGETWPAPGGAGGSRRMSSVLRGLDGVPPGTLAQVRAPDARWRRACVPSWRGRGARSGAAANLPRPSRRSPEVSELVRLEQQGHVALVTLDRPEVLNALSWDTLGRLGEVVGRLARADDVRAVVFTGSGPRAFCAGADLKERVDFTEAQTRAFVARIGDTFESVAALPMPTLAAVNGVALGGGCELALACDLRLLSRNAQIGLTETALAIIPGAGGTQRLPRLVGPA
ncbi:MAG: hypothetical protein FJ296_06190, partial [Planctomycetes bacterium]|nr:hypothetical protein [Planctomycetota bacterium]